LLFFVSSDVDAKVSAICDPARASQPKQHGAQRRRTGMSSKLTPDDRRLLRTVLDGRSLSEVAVEARVSEKAMRNRLAAILCRVRQTSDREARHDLNASVLRSRLGAGAPGRWLPNIEEAGAAGETATIDDQGLTVAGVRQVVRQRLLVAGLTEHRVGRVHLCQQPIAEARVLTPGGREVLVVEVDRSTGKVVYYD
jgi:DNA-binding CsgD family transcriptional regulator